MAEPLTVTDKRPRYDDSPLPPFTAKPIGDNIIVQRIAEPQGLIIEADISVDKPLRCEVLAISKHPSSDLARAALASLVPGDIVLVRRYSGTELKVEGREVTQIIIWDVLLRF